MIGFVYTGTTSSIYMKDERREGRCDMMMSATFDPVLHHTTHATKTPKEERFVKQQRRERENTNEPAGHPSRDMSNRTGTPT